MLLLITTLLFLVSCDRPAPPTLSKITYRYEPGMRFDIQSFAIELDQSLQAPPGLYEFLKKGGDREGICVPDSNHETLVLHFDNGETFTLTSCHRLFEANENLIATDHGISCKKDVDPDSISSAVSSNSVS